jgi:hypothetical protein
MINENGSREAVSNIYNKEIVSFIMGGEKFFPFSR